METTGERLKYFVSMAFSTNKEFSEKSGMANPAMYFTNDRVPGGDLLRRLHELGLNMVWLLTGDGNMFADNAAGRELRNAIATRIATQGERLKELAEQYEGGISVFAAKLGLGAPTSLYKYFRGESPIDKISLQLRKLGIDLNWLFTGEGMPYTNSDAPRYAAEPEQEYVEPTPMKAAATPLREKKRK